MSAGLIVGLFIVIAVIVFLAGGDALLLIAIAAVMYFYPVYLVYGLAMSMGAGTLLAVILAIIAAIVLIVLAVATGGVSVAIVIGIEICVLAYILIVFGIAGLAFIW